MSSVNFNDTFWGLKENWWKQVIDGKYHHLGQEVFDKGLHKGNTEPGYLESAKKASELACENLGKKIDADFYKFLNKTACSHFDQVSRSQINMDPDNSGTFRNTNCRCIMSIAKRAICKIDPLNCGVRKKEPKSIELRISALEYLTSRERYNNLLEIEDNSEDGRFRYYFDPEYTSSELLEFYLKDGIITIKDIFYFREAHQKIDEEVKVINNELKKISEILEIKTPLASIKRYAPHDLNVYVHYQYKNAETIEEIVNKLFDEYYKTVEQPTSSVEKKQELTLNAIAALFQKLEWLHPFADGQGRTDLILLSKLLVEQGFTPAILYDPYFSTTSTLNDWVDYLKQGMVIWKKENKKTA